MPEKLGHGFDVQQCFQAAKKKGYKVFGVQAGNECWSGPKAQDTYGKYGTLLAICLGGKGGALTNDVYRIVRKTV